MFHIIAKKKNCEKQVILYPGFLKVRRRSRTWDLLAVSGIRLVITQTAAWAIVTVISRVILKSMQQAKNKNKSAL